MADSWEDQADASQQYTPEQMQQYYAQQAYYQQQQQQYYNQQQGNQQYDQNGGYGGHYQQQYGQQANYAYQQQYQQPQQQSTHSPPKILKRGEPVAPKPAVPKPNPTGEAAAPKPAAPKPTPKSKVATNVSPPVAPSPSKVDKVTSAMKDVKIAKKKKEKATPVRKEIIIEDDSDPRDHLNVVFIGHVDAGKSTISGNVLYQTGMVDKRVIDKFTREAKERNRDSWFLAFIMDTNEEERAKGKTVEVGRASFETENKRFTILDAPGHKNYVPNMIQGASQADVGILVISARRGEFEAGFDGAGQTREHAMLAKTLGIDKLIVVINKMDEKTVKWSKARYEEIQSKMKPFLRHSCGFRLKRDVQWVPISGMTGENLKDRATAETCPWYRGPSLIELLDKIPVSNRDPKASLRMPILGKMFDRGVIAMGKIESGTLKRGMDLMLMPMNIKTQVISLYVDDGGEVMKECNVAKPGENVRVKLKGVADNDVHKGFVLSSVEDPTPACREFIAIIEVLELLEHRKLITSGYECILHCHTVSEECTFEELLSEMDLKVKKFSKRKPMFVKSKSVIKCKISLKQSIAIETFAKCPQLGRFTLRDEGKTIGIGKIMKIRKHRP